MICKFQESSNIFFFKTCHMTSVWEKERKNIFTELSTSQIFFVILWLQYMKVQESRVSCPVSWVSWRLSWLWTQASPLLILASLPSHSLPSDSGSLWEALYPSCPAGELIYLYWRTKKKFKMNARGSRKLVINKSQGQVTLIFALSFLKLS